MQVVGQQEPEKITERYLAEIIEARMYQIFSKMRNALEKINALQLPGGIILTGGMAALPGVKELAQDVWSECENLCSSRNEFTYSILCAGYRTD